MSKHANSPFKKLPPEALQNIKGFYSDKYAPHPTAEMIRKLKSVNSLSYDNFINGDENSWCLRVIYKNKQNNEDNEDKKESEKKIG